MKKTFTIDESPSVLGELRRVPLDVRFSVVEKILGGEGDIEHVMRELAFSVGRNLDVANYVSNPKLAYFAIQFDQLTGNPRRNLNWFLVERGIGSVDKLLVQVAKLDDPIIFEIDGENNLVFCDGGAEVPNKTINLDYYSASQLVSNDGLELISAVEHDRAQIVTGRRFERKTKTWVECGSPYQWAAVKSGLSTSESILGGYSSEKIGARRLYRHKLNI